MYGGHQVSLFTIRCPRYIFLLLLVVYMGGGGGCIFLYLMGRAAAGWGVLARDTRRGGGDLIVSAGVYILFIFTAFYLYFIVGFN